MSNRTTRLWMIVFVVLVFVCGLSIGLAVSAWMSPARPGVAGFRGQFRREAPLRPPAFVSQRILERLEAETDFTDEQRERLETLFAERENRFLAFNLEMRRRFESEQRNLRQEVAAILTPDQMAIFDTARRSGRPRQRLGPARDRNP